MNNSKVRTLDDLVRYGTTSDLSIKKCANTITVNNVKIFDTLLFDKYRKLIYDNTNLMSLDNDQYNKYRFHPERLATDLYQNPNLSYLILYLNNCSESEFDYQVVRVIDQEAVENVFKLIISQETYNAK